MLSSCIWSEVSEIISINLLTCIHWRCEHATRRFIGSDRNCMRIQIERLCVRPSVRFRKWSWADSEDGPEYRQSKSSNYALTAAEGMLRRMHWRKKNLSKDHHPMRRIWPFSSVSFRFLHISISTMYLPNCLVCTWNILLYWCVLYVVKTLLLMTKIKYKGAGEMQRANARGLLKPYVYNKFISIYWIQPILI